MTINCHAQLFNGFYLILVIMVTCKYDIAATATSSKIQYHQIIKKICPANSTMYIFNHSVHCFINIIGRRQSCLGIIPANCTSTHTQY